ncbi:tRNA dihydrouridine synthase DusB [uncultured Mobiluncus sp.]|uniref:tRNA dihydrouridine synthase DusB n=1 Tax=uncultured Mobiluncus sp. TaxID=293425 RepID=UPI0026204584|nr:tRNA dihydrouridine synthase DusB [uncultured Mobiluncus sp.]
MAPQSPQCKYPPLQIGGVEFTTPIALAPMAGVTNAPFRDLCAEFSRQGLPPDLDSAFRPNVASGTLRGVEGMFVNEMITAKALLMDSARSWVMAQSGPGQTVRVLQLYGVVGADLARAARELIVRDLVDVIDLNFGCPVPKVTRKGGGAALPWKTAYFGELIAQVVQAAREASGEAGRSVDVPVTVKIRVGIDETHETLLDAGWAAQDAGAAALTLHARTTNQYYSGHSDWSRIAELVDALDIPVLGNGDVFSAQDALEMFAQTGCAGIEIGRAVQGRPWIFREITAALWGRPIPAGPTLGEIVGIILAHARGLVEHFGNEQAALRDMRKHVGWYLRGFNLGGATRAELTRIETLDDLESRLHDLVQLLDPNTPYPEAAGGKHGRSRAQRHVKLPEGWLDTREIDDATARILHLGEDAADPYGA